MLPIAVGCVVVVFWGMGVLARTSFVVALAVAVILNNPFILTIRIQTMLSP